MVYRVVREIIQDAMKHNVRYMELRTTPKDLKAGEGWEPEKGVIQSKHQYVENVIRAI